MKTVIQRVSEAKVIVNQEIAGEIHQGLLILLGVEKHDTSSDVERLASKVMDYRIFPDEKGHMNLSLQDVSGELLIVPQFTLAANTKKGLRPSFSSAASPELAEGLYEEFVAQASLRCAKVETGVFGADMKVHLVNDGPVTFVLSSL